jgi:tetratricopeptide (TPR) repeat protein
MAIACSLLAGIAQAKPSIWDVAREPSVERDYQTLVAVERMVARDDSGDPTLPGRFMRAALAVIELAGGTRSADARLLFVAGDLLSDPMVGRDKEARALLVRALRVAPESPLAGRAWFNLAIASARMRDPASERKAYGNALELVWEPGFRSNILANRAESNMVLGDLEAAVVDYRKAIALSDRPDLAALGHYGLGVALERNGDLPRALDAMDVARAIQIPAYDIHYYKALAALAAARGPKKPEVVAAHLLDAGEEWQRYLEHAVPEKHRWIDHARRHQATTLARLEKLAPVIRRRAATIRRER